MYHSALKGTYYEMGYQQGRALKRGGFTLPPPEKKRLQFARRCEDVVSRCMPELVEELHGVVDGSEISYDAIMTLTMTAPFEDNEIPRCSIVAVMPEKTVDGRMIIGRNYDMFYDVSKEDATTYRTYPKGHYASVGNCDIWVGRWDGFNEAGLFTGTTAISLPTPSPIPPGPIGWFTGRHILDHFATVEEAIEFMKKVPRAGSGGRLIADMSGTAVAVEANVETIEIRHPEDGLLVLTNHAASPSFAGKETHVPESSHMRYDRLRELLGGEGITVDDVKRVMADHVGKICAHGFGGSNRKGGTIWSLVGRPGEQEVFIAEGHPCRAKYRRVSF